MTLHPSTLHTSSAFPNPIPVNTMKLHRSLRHFTAAAVLCLGVIPAHHALSQVIFSTDFPDAASYDTNFVKLAPNGTGNTVWSSGKLSKTGTGTQSIIFDTSATGGSGGSGGSSGSQADAGYTNVTVSSEFQVSSLNTASMGFWLHGNAASTSAYLGLINLVSTTSVQLRIFDSNSNPTSTAIGTVLVNQTISLAPSTLAPNTYYTGVFTAENNGSTSVNFTLALYDATGATLIASITGADTTSPVLSGQVGLRLSSQNLLVNDFSVVPEPNQLGLLFLGCALVAYRLRKRSARSLNTATKGC